MKKKSRRPMRWTDLPRDAQKRFADVKGKIPPDVIKDFLDHLERDAQSYIRDAVAALRSLTKPSRSVKRARSKTRTTRRAR